LLLRLTPARDAQAKACGDVLVVGVVSDAEILRNKGPPVYTEEERCVL
jgi:ethanolamine-phosphate cytidylyltransferase